MQRLGGGAGETGDEARHLSLVEKGTHLESNSDKGSQGGKNSNWRGDCLQSVAGFIR